jgi:hypothetical protein
MNPMRVSETYASATLDEIKAALDGGKLVLYAVGRPPSADHAITRSTALATFTFATPAFGPDDADGALKPLFEAPVLAETVGTAGWARASGADGSTVADFSVGPGAAEVKLSSNSATPGFPLEVIAIKTSLPAETVEWSKTEFGHVFVTNSDNAYRKLSVRG